jgi:hypothetical protein
MSDPWFGTGVVQFRKADGETTQLNVGEMLLIDFAAILCGVKPVAYINVQERSPKHRENLRQAANFFGLEFGVTDRVSDSDVRQIFFARSASALREAMHLRTQDQHDSPRMYELLGYPSCCTRSFEGASGAGLGGDVVALAASRTLAPGPWPFFVNSVHNTANRAVTRTGPMCSLRKIHLLPWHPCRFDCQPSISTGKAVWEFIDGLIPDYASLLRGALRTVVLFFGGGHCVVLLGHMISEGRCVYDQVLFATLPPNGHEMRKLSEGNAVYVDGEKARVVQEGRTSLVFSRPRPMLLDFTGH